MRDEATRKAIAYLVTPSVREGFVLGALTALALAGVTPLDMSHLLEEMGVSAAEVEVANTRLRRRMADKVAEIANEPA
jgi:hypothetical protein